MEAVSVTAVFVMAHVTVLKTVVMSWAVTVPLVLCVTTHSVYHRQNSLSSVTMSLTVLMVITMTVLG